MSKDKITTQLANPQRNNLKSAKLNSSGNELKNATGNTTVKIKLLKNFTPSSVIILILEVV